MIVVDTSALMAIALGEDDADACIEVLARDSIVLISAATVAETLIVADRRNVGAEVTRLIEELDFEVVHLTYDSARQVANAYGRWGKGIHVAGLNLGDCFAYALARQSNCPLLYVGDDFTKTDIDRAQ